jgi:hypothetical protein
MAVGFKLEGQDFEDIYVKWNQLPFYEGILDSEYRRPGGMWAFGDGIYGGTGLSSNISRSSPMQVGSLTTWAQVSCGGFFAAAVKTDGSLWAWGIHVNGQLGIGPIVAPFSQSSPVRVGALSNWKHVCCGGSHSVAIKTDGTLWSWGNNGSGKLGLGNVVHRSSPVQVGALTNWRQVSCAISHTLAIKTDGTLWSWGANTTGELGTGTIVWRSSPVQVGSLTNWRVVEGGGFAFSAAVKTDGSLWTWGDNTNGQLGLGNVVHRSSPVQVGSLIDWNSITCGHRHAVAIKTDGSLWTWGDNTYGQLGIGDVVPRSSPVQVGSLTTWAQVVAGMYYTVALKTDGTLWSWGENTHGQLGIGDVVHRSSPVQVGSLTVWKTLPKNLDDANFVCLQY